jgi:hypothetical protein
MIPSVRPSVGPVLLQARHILCGRRHWDGRPARVYLLRVVAFIVKGVICFRKLCCCISRLLLMLAGWPLDWELRAESYLCYTHAQLHGTASRSGHGPHPLFLVSPILLEYYMLDDGCTLTDRPISSSVLCCNSRAHSLHTTCATLDDEGTSRPAGQPFIWLDYDWSDTDPTWKWRPTILISRRLRPSRVLLPVLPGPPGVIIIYPIQHEPQLKRAANERYWCWMRWADYSISFDATLQ